MIFRWIWILQRLIITIRIIAPIIIISISIQLKLHMTCILIIIISGTCIIIIQVLLRDRYIVLSLTRRSIFIFDACLRSVWWARIYIVLELWRGDLAFRFELFCGCCIAEILKRFSLSCIWGSFSKQSCLQSSWIVFFIIFARQIIYIELFRNWILVFLSFMLILFIFDTI